MIDNNIINEIQEDINIFQEIPEDEQNKLTNVLLNNGILITDKLFEKLAQEKDINIINNKIEFLIEFLIKMGNFVINILKEKIYINDLLEKLTFKDSYSKINLQKLFSNDSDFLKSLEIDKIANLNTDTIYKYTSNNGTLQLKYGRLLAISKINIKTKNKKIELILDSEQLIFLKNCLEENIKELDKFKNEVENTKINFLR